MRILAFDVGIVNMAFIDISMPQHGEPVTINEWDVLDISNGNSKPTFSDLAKQLCIVLSRFKNTSYSSIVIENQPCMKNPVMKSLQIVIYTYYLINNLDKPITRFINASSKFKPNKLININMIRDAVLLVDSRVDQPAKLTYSLRKKFAIHLVFGYLALKNVNDCDRITNIFNNHKKKDDMADALLLAFASI